ncbi:uncharacterized protein LOC143919268 [Arctopsyche grandis]|uniref:uncharacterized protein LOC143919268 n=1 Tax=Arctopsyche grandis TaxID=121162 RepID=UPI00406D86E3
MWIRLLNVVSPHALRLVSGAQFFHFSSFALLFEMGKKGRRRFDPNQNAGPIRDSFGQVIEPESSQTSTKTKPKKDSRLANSDKVTRKTSISNNSDTGNDTFNKQEKHDTRRERVPREQSPYSQQDYNDPERKRQATDRANVSDAKDEDRRDASGSGSQKSGKSHSEGKNKHVSSENTAHKSKKDQTSDDIRNHQKDMRNSSGSRSQVSSKPDSDNWNDFKKSSEFSKHKKSSRWDSGDQKGSLCRIEEVKGDLFDVEDTFSLAHCVAEDLQMGAGIAVEFRERFKKTGYLASLGVKTGGVAVLQIKERFIYYLITKRNSKGKPTLGSVTQSLIKMATHVEKNDVKQIAMPTIGCGLDKLDWGDVLDKIQSVFSHLDVYIRIYHYVKSESPRDKYHKCAIVNHMKDDLINTISGTGIVYLSDAKEISEHMMQLNEKHSFLDEFNRTPKQLGSVVRTETRVGEIAYGLVCKRGDKILYDCLEEGCLLNLRKILAKDEYLHIGIQAHPTDSMITNYVINLFKYNLPNHIKIWVYWGNLVPNEFNEYREY